MRPILLDTCAALWLVADAPMGEAAMESISAAHRTKSPLRISPITAWEIGLMARKGRFRSSLSPQRWFEQLRTLPDVQLCDLGPDVLLAASFLPGDLHGDPADRIMVATAREHGFTLMTRDRALLDYAETGHLAAIAC